MPDAAPVPIPHDYEAERRFVGAIMAGNGQALIDVPAITADLCFQHVTHTVLQACIDLHAANQKVNSFTVSHRLRDSGIESVAYEVARMAEGGLESLVPYYLPQLQEQLAKRRLQSVFAWGNRHIASNTDPDEIIFEVQRQIAGCNATADAENLLPIVVADFLKELDEMDSGQQPRALQTAIGVWNRVFGGLPEGAYFALGGRPGTGKTAMMEQIVVDLLADGESICVFERDMSPKKLLKRMACRLARVSYSKLNKGFCTQEERGKVRNAAENIGLCHLRLHNPVGLTADKLCAIVRREQKQFGIKAVFIDHIQVLDVGNMERQPGLTRASTMIRAAATQTGIPHVALFHINRAGAKDAKRPTPEDVKDFDQLFGDVDGMAMLWRETRPEDLKPGEPEIIKFYTAKNRDDGVVEEDLVFDGRMMSFDRRETL